MLAVSRFLACTFSSSHNLIHAWPHMRMHSTRYKNPPRPYIHTSSLWFGYTDELRNAKSPVTTGEQWATPLSHPPTCRPLSLLPLKPNTWTWTPSTPLRLQALLALPTMTMMVGDGDDDDDDGGVGSRGARGVKETCRPQGGEPPQG